MNPCARRKEPRDDDPDAAPLTPARRSRLRRVLGNLAWVLTGVLLTVLMLANPTAPAPRGPLGPRTPRPSAGPTSARAGRLPASAGAREIISYRNPMDPTITSPVPMKDSMGMDYVPVYSDDGTKDGKTIRIDPVVVQNMNVQTARVERRDLYHPIRTVGYLDYDQERMVTVATRYSGWIEKTYVNYVGEPVRKGAPLFEIYSPELVQTEEELLSALRFARDMENAPADARRRAESLAESARTRLGYWDISESQIQELEATGKVVRTLTVVAPASGLVMKRMPGLEGMAVSPGMELFHIADLSTLWMSVELFEDQMEWVEVGTPAEFTLSYFPGEAFHGRVRYLEPELSERTRTLAVRIEVPNPQGRLRKGMFATVAFSTAAVKDALVVPTEAVLRTGQRSVLIVALGEGRFLPRDVLLGPPVEGSTQILERSQRGRRGGHLLAVPPRLRSRSSARPFRK